MRTETIFGPPGTGKTTALIRLVEEAMRSGVPASRIAFVAFTRKAAGEAKERATQKFGLQDEELPWFRTLHSAAFRLLGLNRAQIMAPGDYISICRHLGLYITLKRNNDDDAFSGMTKGDRLFFTENIARVRGLTLEQAWEQMIDDDLNWTELARLRSTLSDYKRRTNKMDFTDMIEAVVTRDVRMPVTVAFIDEAQDLSEIQWRAIEALFRGVERRYFAGDDDQSIFKWAGADADRLMEIDGHRTVLPQSYRVPILVQDAANKIISGVSKRVPKTWTPTQNQGSISHCSDISQIDMSSGTWLLLARNVAFLSSYTQHCLRDGLVFDAPVDCPLRGESLVAIVTWEKMRKGDEVSVADAKAALDMITSNRGIAHGFKTKLEREKKPDDMIDIITLRRQYGLITQDIWHRALDRISAVEREYFLAALKRGEKLLRKPRIKISTIHGAKGGEADNVVILPDMAARTWREYERNPDDEHRVWYVALTRAKERVFMMEPSSSMHYAFNVS